jgi:signal transduction histidine kinase
MTNPLRRRTWTLPEVPLRRRLFLLAAASLLPLALMSGVGLLWLANQQRAQAERAGLDISRALVTAVDVELRRSIAVLEVLALSVPRDESGAREFDLRARRVLATRSDWRAIVLADANGNIWVHTGFPFGSPQAQLADKAGFARAVQTRRPTVGYLRAGLRGEFGVPVRVPVLRDGEPHLVLTAVLIPQAIADVVRRQRVPEDWVVSVFDAQGMRVARSRAHERYVGTPAAPGLQALMASGGAQGAGKAQSLEGETVWSAYTRSSDTGWTVAIGLPTSMMAAGSLGSLAAFAGGLLLSMGLGALAALAVARSISRPIGELRNAAQALGRGEGPLIPRTDLHEVREVGEAMVVAARQLEENEGEREQLLDAERAARSAAERARRRLELLAKAGTLLSASLDAQATLQTIASLVAPGIADWCRIDLIDANGALQRAIAHHADAKKAREGLELAQRLRASPQTPGSMAWAVAEGRSRLAHFDSPAAFDALGDPALAQFARAIGMHAYFVVPLVARGRTLGAMAALQAESGRRFSEDDCALVAELAQRAALALDNARLYAEAESARREAERANRAKDEFLAMLGHELRNPLAPIVTALHLMERRGEASTRHERRIIERQVGHLSRLVDDLLDIARITEGKVELLRERLEIAAVIGRALELTRPLFDARSRPLELELPDKPLYVVGDAVRLAQVLGNLLNNAVKFSRDDARIVLRASAVGDELELQVQDEGRGIEPELLPRVFDSFVQGAQQLARQGGGLGLGLAIVKTLVRMHGGSVRAHSEGAGRGSTFTVRLPLAEEPMIGPRAPAAQPFQGTR